MKQASPAVEYTDNGQSSPAANGSAGRTVSFDEVRRQVIELCVGMSKVIGMPRSVGEIFGFIFSSAEPKTFDAVVQELGISAGSASHGLRYLRRIGVIRSVYLARDRRDHFTAETSFHVLLKGFLGEAVMTHLVTSHDRLEKLKESVKAGDDANLETLGEKLEVLLEWHQQARKAMDLVMTELQ